MAYDPEKAKQVCELLAENEIAKSLRQACNIVGIAPSTFLLWCDKGHKIEDEDGKTCALAEQYARAVRIATDLDFEELQEMVDKVPERNRMGVDVGWVANQRLKADVKKWAMSKRHPTKYADKIEHSGDIKVTHEIKREQLLGRILDRTLEARPELPSETDDSE